MATEAKEKKEKKEKKPGRREQAIALVLASGKEGMTISQVAEELGTHVQYARRFMGEAFEKDELTRYEGARRAGYLYFGPKNMPSEKVLAERFAEEEEEDDSVDAEDEDEDDED